MPRFAFEGAVLGLPGAVLGLPCGASPRGNMIDWSWVDRSARRAVLGRAGPHTVRAYVGDRVTDMKSKLRVASGAEP
jgi:hypothetical protein